MASGYPDPQGDKPVKWPPQKWLGWQLLWEQRTLLEVATSTKRSRGTVALWVKNWRDEFGDDLFRHRAPGMKPEYRADPALGGRAVKASWTKMRAEAAAEFGAGAVEGRALGRALLAKFVEKDFDDLTVDDWWKIVRGTERLAKIAEMLGDVPKTGPARPTGQGGPSGAVPPGTLDALGKGRATTPKVRNVMEMITVSMARYEQTMGETVIEVEEPPVDSDGS